MTRPRSSTNRVAWAVMLATALLVSASPTTARQTASTEERASAEAPGDKQLVNFEHVYNFTPTGPPLDQEGKGTDHEFYTASVPKRDYGTGQLLDSAGNPLPAGAAPVIESRDFAIMGSYLGGAWVFDITDPEHPQFVKNIPCNQTQNDIQIKQFGDRWILALARDGNDKPCADPSKGGATGAGIAVFDVTDPYNFTPLYNFRTVGGAHNFTFHPTKPYGWVSTGDLPGGSNHIPIIDFTDVDNPVLAADIAVQGGPHDIVFTVDGLRAYVASENNYRIYNTTDPKAPVQINSQLIPNQGTYAHGFDPTPDRKLAVTTNESLALGGFFGPSTAVCPGEGLAFYNVDGNAETNPQRLGTFLASVTGPIPPGDNRACTGHVGKLGNKAMTLGWYIGGVRVVDYSNPAQAREVGIAVMPGAEVWSAKFYKGPYVYASDMRRGFDVFRWTGEQPPPWQDTPIGPLPKGPPPCLTPTLVGGAGDSVLTGTPGNDVIVDTGGDNVIRGNGGNDTICTGPGNDDIKTTNGSDVVVDEGGNNRIVTGGGNDNVTSGGGRDVIRTGAGRDRVSSGGGKDKVNGGGGRDNLRTGSGRDTIRGGPGRDVCKAGGRKNTVKGC